MSRHHDNDIAQLKIRYRAPNSFSTCVFAQYVIKKKLAELNQKAREELAHTR